MRFRIRYAHQIVGLFVLVALILLFGTLIFMGINQRLFSRNYLYRSEFRSAEGLSLGMSIRLRGFEIGKVQSILLNENNRVDVILSIYDTYLDRVKPNSVVELVTSPLGLGASLNFLPGNNLEPPLPELSFIPSTDTPLGKAIIQQGLADRPEGDEALSRIVSGVQQLIVSVQELVEELTITAKTLNRDLSAPNVASVQGVTGEIFRTIANVQKISSNLEALLSQLSPRVNSLLASVAEIAQNLVITSEGLRDPRGLVPRLLDPKGSLATLLDDNNELYLMLQATLAELNRASREINRFSQFVSRQSPALAGLVEETRITIRQAQDVLEGLANNPLLRGGIPERPPTVETIRSARDDRY